MKKVKTTCILTCENNGASNQTRTDDPRFTRVLPSMTAKLFQEILAIYLLLFKTEIANKDNG
jgi:hypothetical protein